LTPRWFNADFRPLPYAERIGTEAPIGTYQTVLPLTLLKPSIGVTAGKLVVSCEYFASAARALATVADVLEEPAPDAPLFDVLSAVDPHADRTAASPTTASAVSVDVTRLECD
jgi:hypothetical protein